MTPSAAEPTWIPALVVTSIHRDQIQEHGGLPGLRDADLLQSALARPRQRWTYDPDADFADLAAAYGFGIVRNHPFQDGNKRVGLLAIIVFLGLNGLAFRASQSAAVETIIRLASGQLTEQELASWIRQNSAPRISSV